MLPYQIKVRDYLKSESSIWEIYSKSSGDEWEITDRIIAAIFEKNDEDSGFWQMARLYRIYTAFSCDRAAGKVSVPADDLTYSIRQRALELWQEQGETAEPAIANLFEGQQELGSLDAFDRERIRELTREVIRAFLRPAWMRMAHAVVLALEYFPDLTWAREDDVPDEEVQLQNLATEHGSIRDYFAFVLVDFVLADPSPQDRVIERAVIFASRLGIADSFAHVYNENYGKPNQHPL